MITNRTPSISDLASGLLADRAPSRPDPQRPGTTWLRPALMSTGTQSTYVVPGDWPTEQEGWYEPAELPYPRRSGNMEFYVDGRATFAAMLEAIETATRSDHFILLLGWAAYFDFILVPDDSPHASRTQLAGRTGLQVLKEKIDQGVQVRVLLWDNNAPTEYTEVARRNNIMQKAALDALAPASLPGSRRRQVLCILDSATRSWGAHHQKILLVGGGDGLIGFFGGVDINPDRVDPVPARFFIGPAFMEVGAPLHDVHARVRGQAAEDLLDIAVDRWNYSTPTRIYMTEGEREMLRKGTIFGQNLLSGHDPALSPDEPEDALPSIGHGIENLQSLAKLVTPAGPPWPLHSVRIGQTIGNPRLKVAGRPNAKSTAWTFLKHAIGQARRFIYVEDQYLWSLEAARELAKALPAIEHLTLLVAPDDIISGTPRHAFVGELFKNAVEADKKKIGLYNRKPGYHQYIHSKMFIIDDELVVLGSANCNNRGYHHDSEDIGVVADLPWDDADGTRLGRWHVLEMNLAHKLRVSLWAEHLQLPAAELWDGVAAVVHWRSPPPGAPVQIQPYIAAPGALELTQPAGSGKNHLIDPILVDPE
jgi:phosphatidylserine/phosphatidylglycerophosphate/cardiolipin synthase-like enzyme